MNAIAHRVPFRHIFGQVGNHVRQKHTDVHVIYNNPQRFHAAGMTLVAAGQAGFWASATAIAQQVPEPLFSPSWTVAGFGLSAAFIGIIGAYLRRNVAELSLLNGPSLRITAHSFCGMLRKPVTVPADAIIPGPKQDDTSERYWTIGVRQASGRKFYYLVDTKNGVVDWDALGAIARGGDHLLVFSHKRDGGLMRHRWEEWERTRVSTKSVTKRPHRENPA